MARLGDMDNAAELDRKKAVSPTFLDRQKKLRMKDEPLRFRTVGFLVEHYHLSTHRYLLQGTPKFIARSPALGRLLVTNLAFRRMPQLKGELAEKYRKVYEKDTSCLRAFVDDRSTKHGGVYDADLVEEKYEENEELIVTEFEHHPRHDAESVFWCMVVFLLIAVPLGSPEEVIPKDPADFPLFCAWRHIANHQVGPSQDICDSRAGLLAGGKLWVQWLHPDLAHAGPLLAALAAQVSPEWGVLDPQPRALHLHEAMQRIMLEHLYLWKEKKLDVKFDAGRVRPTIPPDNRTAHQVCTTPSPDGQQIAAGSLKRQSQHLGPTEESKAKSAYFYILLTSYSSDFPPAPRTTNDKGRGTRRGTSPSNPSCDPTSTRRTAPTSHELQQFQRKPLFDTRFRVCPPVAS